MLNDNKSCIGSYELCEWAELCQVDSSHERATELIFSIACWRKIAMMNISLCGFQGSGQQTKACFIRIVIGRSECA